MIGHGRHSSQGKHLVDVSRTDATRHSIRIPLPKTTSTVRSSTTTYEAAAATGRRFVTAKAMSTIKPSATAANTHPAMTAARIS